MCNHDHSNDGHAAPHEAFLPRRKLLQGLAAGGAIAAASSVSGCSTNPYTGSKQFLAFGNRVGFYKGMMDFAESDDAIAGIMGHEVGHVAGAHARARMSAQMASQVAVVGGTILGGSQLSKKCKTVPVEQRNTCLRKARQQTAMLQQALGLGVLLGVTLPYSRKHETESDLLGANYMYHAGYDPYQSVKLWEKMAAASTSRQPTILSTHPDPADRAKVLAAYIARQEKAGSQGFKNIRT